VSGTRVDGKPFSITAAQMLNVTDLEDARDPEVRGEMVMLSRLEGEETHYSAQAEYTDFNQRKTTFRMTGWGQFKSSKDEEDGILTTSERREDGDGYLTKVTTPWQRDHLRVRLLRQHGEKTDHRAPGRRDGN